MAAVRPNALSFMSRTASSSDDGCAIGDERLNRPAEHFDAARERYALPVGLRAPRGIECCRDRGCIGELAFDVAATIDRADCSEARVHVRSPEDTAAFSLRR